MTTIDAGVAEMPVGLAVVVFLKEEPLRSSAAHSVERDIATTLETATGEEAAEQLAGQAQPRAPARSSGSGAQARS